MTHEKAVGPKRQRRLLKVANYFRSGETNGAGEALFEVRLYTAGTFEATLSVPATLLQDQLNVLRAQGYLVERLST